MNPLDKHNSGNYLFGGLFLKHFYSIYDYDQELISLGINSHSEGLVDMYPSDKMKKSEEGVKVKQPDAKDETKKVEAPKATEAPKDEKKVQAPKAAEKTPDASSESNSAFADAVATEKLAGKAPVEGVP